MLSRVTMAGMLREHCPNACLIVFPLDSVVLHAYSLLHAHSPLCKYAVIGLLRLGGVVAIHKA